MLWILLRRCIGPLEQSTRRYLLSSSWSNEALDDNCTRQVQFRTPLRPYITYVIGTPAVFIAWTALNLCIHFFWINFKNPHSCSGATVKSENWFVSTGSGLFYGQCAYATSNSGDTVLLGSEIERKIQRLFIRFCTFVPIELHTVICNIEEGLVLVP